MSTRPSSGVRFVVTRVLEVDAGRLVYRGYAHTPDADWPLEVRLDEGKGSATVEGTLPEAERQQLADAALRLVRAGAKGDNPPRKLVRWRELT